MKNYDNCYSSQVSRSCKSYVKSIIFLSKPRSKTDQKSDIEASIYTNKLSFIQNTKLCDIVASPTINQISRAQCDFPVKNSLKPNWMRGVPNNRGKWADQNPVFKFGQNLLLFEQIQEWFATNFQKVPFCYWNFLISKTYL